jgi:ribonuclease BN (tRNA processing enzyme)
MRLTVLGSGSCISGAERAATGFVLEIGRLPVVVDMGYGCFKNIQRAGFDYPKINHLFFTHFEHPDHINDLASFLFAKQCMIQGGAQPIQANLFAAKGFRRFIKNLVALYPFFEKIDFKLNVNELDFFETKKFSAFKLTTKKMEHAKSSIAYRFEAGSKSIVFSGDTKANENLVALAENADLLVAECTALKPVQNHLTPQEIAAVASRAGAKAVLLHHMEPQAERVDIRPLVKENFGGKVLVARDLMQVNV